MESDPKITQLEDVDIEQRSKSTPTFEVIDEIDSRSRLDYGEDLWDNLHII